jgi:hypothetical protein
MKEDTAGLNCVREDESCGNVAKLLLMENQNNHHRVMQQDYYCIGWIAGLMKGDTAGLNHV